MLAVEDLPFGSWFAEELSEELRARGARVFLVSTEDFQRPAADRLIRGDTGAAVYFDRYDYAALLRVLVDPFLMGGSTAFVPAFFDAARDMPVEPDWLTAPEDAVLVVNGPFLQRPELVGRWHFSVLVERTVIVDDEWSEAAEIYAAQSQPRRQANAVVDARNPDRPVRVFADSC